MNDYKIPISKAIEAVNDEPEYPGEMPEDMKDAIIQAMEEKDLDLITEAMRITVRLTKIGIRLRIKNIKEE